MAAAGAERVLTCINSLTGSFTFAEPPAAAGPAAAAGQRMGTIGPGPAAAAAAAAAASDSFEAYLAGVQQTGVVPLQMPLFCAHQMGTCRLGERGCGRGRGAGRGELWGAGAAHLGVLAALPQPAGLACCAPWSLPAGADPKTSVLDPKGECWEVRPALFLFVCLCPFPSLLLPADLSTDKSAARPAFTLHPRRWQGCTAPTARASPPPPASTQ